VTSPLAAAKRFDSRPENGVRAPRASLFEYVRACGLASLVLGVSKDPNAKVTILLVSPANGRPTLAVKAPTTRGAECAVRAETGLLTALEKVRSERLLSTVPRVVDLVEFEGRTAVVMTALPGVPMTTAYMRPGHTARLARVAADFRAVGGWLAELQAATAGARAQLEMDAGVTAHLSERFAGERRIADDIARLRELHDRLRANVVPRTAVHGDLWMGNVLLTGRDVSGVVDWEAGASSGSPVRDLVRFAHMYALYLDRRTRPGRYVRGHAGLRAGKWGAGVEYALTGSGWFPDMFRNFLRTSLTGLGASAASWHDAALCGIAEVAALTDDPDFARRHLELFRRMSGAPRDRAAGRAAEGA